MLLLEHVGFFLNLSGTIQITPALTLERVGGTTVQRTSRKEGEKNAHVRWILY